ncbi:putative aminophospholipid-translocase [Binucleata daphniae]
MEESRLVDIGTPKHTFSKNIIRNQRYSWYTFVFVVFFAQFKHFFNIYFFLICFTQFFDRYSVSPLISNIAPWVFVLTFTFVKEGLDDYKRYLRDREANSQIYQVIRKNSTEMTDNKVKADNTKNENVKNENVKEENVKKNDKQEENAEEENTKNYKAKININLDVPNEMGVNIDTEQACLNAHEKTKTGLVNESHDQDYFLLKIPSSDICVGDILLLEKNKRIPADCVLLTSTDNDVFIRTDQLDGETDWKLRIPALNFTTKTADLFDYTITADKPHKDIYNFIGKITQKTKDENTNNMSDISDDGMSSLRYKTIPISLENTLWMNTVFASSAATACVIYTGNDTRAILNTTRPKSKFGLIDEEINFYSKFLCAVSLLFAIVFTVLRGITQKWDSTLIRFLVIFSSVIPISLKVSIDLARYFYTVTIERDIECTVRNSNIPEELGRISYLLTDKTGTLTCNEMEMRKVHLGTVSYTTETEHEVTSLLHQKLCQDKNLCTKKDQASENESINENIHENTKNSAQENKNTNLMQQEMAKNNTKNSLESTKTSDYTTVSKTATTQSSNVQHDHLFSKKRKRKDLPNKIYDLVIGLSVCHNVTPLYDAGQTTYQASSPDEVAIVQWTDKMGIKLIQRSSTKMTLRDFEKEIKFEILCIFPFTSDSKRMGIIVKNEMNEISFYMKGADVVMKNIVKSSDWLSEETDNMAREGLRTLVIGRKILTQEEYTKFMDLYNTACSAMENRNAKIVKAIASIEHDLTIMGLTGVEDRLQDGVKISLENMRNAGIKIWMLTGDKVETATCIAISSKLFAKTGTYKTIENVRTKEQAENMLGEITGVDKRESNDDNTKKNTKKEDNARKYYKRKSGDKNKLNFNDYDTRFIANASLKENTITKENTKKYYSFDSTKENRRTFNYLIIDGVSIHTFMDNYKKEFFDSLSSLDAVVCCRCSPTQKADIAEAIKYYTKKRVSCIGDGGNDVSMITAADLGIGIVGKEGKQASLAADFSLERFKDICPLFLWHGRNCYKSTARLSHLIIHRGTIISVMQAIFCSLFSFSPFTLYQGPIIVGYVTLYTFFPVFCSIMSRDATKKMVYKYPELYKEMNSKPALSPTAFATWNVVSFYQGAMIMLLSFILFQNEMYGIITITFSSLIINEMGMVFLSFKRPSIYMILSLFVSLLFYGLSFIFLKNELVFSFPVKEFIWKIAFINFIAICFSITQKIWTRRINPSAATKLAEE